jgi:hypothetical protein
MLGFRDSKKAQGMSLNVVIIAVIVLIILVVLVVIFAGKIKIFGGQTTETTSQYQGLKCKMPGVNAECSSDKEGCTKSGGSYDDRQFDDCSGTGCCYS